MAPTKDISISIGEAEISFNQETKAPDGVSLSVKQTSKFLFEFAGNITDKFSVKKTRSPGEDKLVTEIYLERGLGADKQSIPLVRITHFS